MRGRGGWGMRSGVGVIAHPSSHASVAVASCTHHPPYKQLLVGMEMGAMVVLSLHGLSPPIHPASRGLQAWGGCVVGFGGCW
ncbi:hypothetical protein L208DRAFT_1414837 [Tricholoma matsutake]|nr:hypothetical protein L208DRAFT_1414837 [Tricholoma matsutake 945]